MDSTTFDQLVERLETTAERSPLAYKTRVGLLAVLGYAYIFGILAALLAILGLLGLAASTGKYLFVIAKIGLPLLILAAVILRALWVRLDEPAGRLLTPRDAPQLFAVLAEMRRRLRGPRIHGVLLTDDYNASVVQTPRLGLFGWQKNHLILGLPLMQALSPEQFCAVLAHEYGHLAGAHSRFSIWIYRIRKSWHQLMEALDREGRASFLFKKFFDWYPPYFAAYSFVLARANEYQADDTAKELVGARHAADALINLSLKGTLLHDRFWPDLHAKADLTPAPAFSPFAQMAGALREPVDVEEQRQWLKSALARKTGSDDTHPSLTDRLRALGQPPRIPEPAAISAAQRYFGDKEQALAEDLDRDWRERIEPSWRERFEHVQKGKAEIARLSEKAEQGELPLQEVWDLAYWTEQIETGVAALPLYQAVLARAPDDATPNFAVGRLLLASGDEAGIAHMEKAMTLDPGYTLRASEWIADFLYRRGREDDAQPYIERARTAKKIVAEAEEERAALTTADRFEAHGLSDEVLNEVRKSLAKQPRIAKAWLARKALKHHPDENPVFGLAVRTVFWYPGGKKYVSKLCKEVVGVGTMYIVVVNAFDEDAYRKMGKKIKKTPGALIYRR